jgi:3-methyl-2-oxobutanoate hydroxymethyltransferase
MENSMRTSVREIRAMKDRGELIVMLTAYDYPSAAIIDRVGIPVILVGDSVGMVVHGQPTTIPVTVDQMIMHAAAVVRGSAKALVVGDLPFLSYATFNDALNASARLMQMGGVQAVKLEGAGSNVEIVRRLVELGIPVMGHLGYTPQSTHQIGTRAQAKSAEGAKRLLNDALELEQAGAFALVLELVPAELGRIVSQRLAIPTIGIGAGHGCDGQVQVWHDVLGLFHGKPPRHAKAYAQLAEVIEGALRTYAEEVRSRAFPTALQSIDMEETELAELRRLIDGGS